MHRLSFFFFENRQFLLHTLTALLRAVNLRKNEKCSVLRIVNFCGLGFYFPTWKRFPFFNINSNLTRERGPEWKLLRSGQFFRWFFKEGRKLKKPISGFCSRHFLKNFQPIYCHKFEIEITRSRFMRKRKEFRAKSWKFVWPAYQISSQVKT